MDSSRLISRILGLYLVLVNGLLFFHQDVFLASIQSLSLNPGLIFILGNLLIVLGLVMVIFHNIWQWNWRLLVTLLCWLTLIKGLAIIINPNFILRIVASMTQYSHQILVSIIIDFILGLILCYLSFNKK